MTATLLPMSKYLTIVKFVRYIKMTEAAVTSKGQITIPASIRKAMGIKAQDRVVFTVMPDGTTVMRAKTKDISSLAGSIRKPAKKIEISDMKMA
jgi:AbrB family looped-hinge helix DNA binding protein